MAEGEERNEKILVDAWYFDDNAVVGMWGRRSEF